MKVVIKLNDSIMASKEIDITFDIEKKPYMESYKYCPFDDFIQDLQGNKKYPNLDIWLTIDGKRKTIKEKLIQVKFDTVFALDDTWTSFNEKIKKLTDWLEQDSWTIIRG